MATLRSPLLNVQRLRDCEDHDKDHVDRGSGDHVTRIQQALLKLGASISVTGVYDEQTKTAVVLYKRPRNLLQPGQVDPDPIVGRRTIKSLDDELMNPKPRVIPVEVTPRDTLVFISGVVDDGGFGGKELDPADGGPQFQDFAQVPSRPGFGKRVKGFGGSLVNSVGVVAAVNFIEQGLEKGSKVILYGYSAGAKQLLEVCERLNGRNTARRDDNQQPIRVDLLVTNDVAAKEKTATMRRVVAACVTKNLNMFQQLSAPNGSHGGPNSGPCNPRNVDMTMLASAAALAASTNERRKVSPHAIMQTLAHPSAMAAIRAELR